MKIIVNGEPASTAAGTLADLLAELELADAIVATAVNGDMVRAAKREATPIADGDRVEILAPMQGG
ncbi:sulfur carrier protein ThiS [Ancylobacter dichloromethanicus]|uniref:Thiamine biosynthesis protein ThiS n=1 Tax=Ancylobacter dichloromethanicus TaxID=518825 RepID=A0A9W6JAG8_9HYPH|nr:sulfur carrier protein ThiS [Ancylobacter dichloromethanicus]MBS7553630.1 sulfur carrier protein ThiS [Ancylobacter dichloromethanicus]GLK72693.1 thiamine biosynthesis protein ThiS [Ancylobacter dichloromethanicus]